MGDSIPQDADRNYEIAKISVQGESRCRGLREENQVQDCHTKQIPSGSSIHWDSDESQNICYGLENRLWGKLNLVSASKEKACIPFLVLFHKGANRAPG